MQVPPAQVDEESHSQTQPPMPLISSRAPGGVKEGRFPSEDTFIPQGLWPSSESLQSLLKSPVLPWPLAVGPGGGGSLFLVQPSLNLLAAVSIPNTLFKTNATL